MASTWDGTTHSLFVNGQQVGTEECSLIPGSVADTPLLIGSEWVGAPEFRNFFGQILHVAVWNYELTTDEIVTAMGNLIDVLSLDPEVC